jgi:hypothetical protein
MNKIERIGRNNALGAHRVFAGFVILARGGDDVGRDGYGDAGVLFFLRRCELVSMMMLLWLGA